MIGEVLPNRRGQLAASSGKPVEDVKVIVPFPRAVSTITLTCNVGNYMFDDISKVLEWTIGKIPSDKTPLIQGNVSFPPDTGDVEENIVVTAEFKLQAAAAPLNCKLMGGQGQSVSGIGVDSLSLMNEKYKPYKVITWSPMARSKHMIAGCAKYH